MIKDGCIKIDDRDEKSCVPLHYAVVDNDNLKMMRFMLMKGADVNAENYLGNTIIKAHASSSVCPLNEENF
jgi:ankyrin repeat protein